MLRAERLSCLRNHNQIFCDISFELKTGEMLFVQGPNGSGKSSLLRMLIGLASPYLGEIYWQEHPIKKLRSLYWKDLHYIGHSNGHKLGLTVIENLKLSGTLTPKLNQVLDFLQLTIVKNTFTKNLSAGQKRRVALAKLFLFPKKLWILDEPLAALDINTQKIVLSHLECHLQNGGIAVVSSHHPLLLNHVIVKNLTLC